NAARHSQHPDRAGLLRRVKGQTRAQASPHFGKSQKNRNSQAPPLDGYAERSSTSSFGGMVSARRMLTPCFRAVEMTERIAANISAPTTVRNPPEIFIRSFIMRISRSAWLLVNGTSKSAVN